MTTILVAEVDWDIGELMVDTLFDKRYDILESKDGREAVDIAIKEAPDLILLDVTMPFQDGFAVVKKLKENILTESIPVVMLTAMGALDSEQSPGSGRKALRLQVLRPGPPSGDHAGGAEGGGSEGGQRRRFREGVGRVHTFQKRKRQQRSPNDHPDSVSIIRLREEARRRVPAWKPVHDRRPVCHRQKFTCPVRYPRGLRQWS